MGTLVGYRKLLGDRQARRENPIEHVADAVAKRNDDTFDMTMRYAHDFTRTVGYLGMHSLYGMVVYPWMPLYLAGGTIRRDMKSRFTKNSN
jgi:hypothetical protein